MTNQAQNFKKYGIDTLGGIPQGLKLNTKAPDFSGINQYGDTVSLSHSLKKGPVVLFFYRGYWCPVCNKYLQKMQDSLTVLKDSGAVLIGVSPQVARNTAKSVEKHKLQFDVLSDSTDKIAQDYDVLFNVSRGYRRMVSLGLFTSIAKTNGEEQARLPVPATYIINRKGIIVYRHFDYDYHHRASVSDIIAHLPKDE